MNIAIDASSAAVQKQTGIGKYIIRLIENLEKQGDTDHYTIYYRLSRWRQYRCFYQPSRRTTQVRLFQEPFFSARGIDVFHGPDARLPFIHGPKLVATVHDVFSLVSHEFAEKEFREMKIARYRDVARRADRIICVSKNTQRDFLTFFPYAKSKTCVIGEGVDAQFYPRLQDEIDRIKNRYGIRSDYVLCVGAFSKRKNVLRMLEAFLKARQEINTDLQFVAVGNPSDASAEIFQYAEKNGYNNIVVLAGYVPDEDLPALYSGARLFLFTTLYEGFGLPILEALACGAPVLTSNISSLPEVGGSSVCTANPRDVEDIKQKLMECLKKPKSSSFCGHGQADYKAHFSWERMASDTLKVYRSLYKEK
jgi:glycosyltransferase involved in cell wall biosynthesis